MRGSFSRSKTPRMGATLDGASRLDSPMSGASRLGATLDGASSLDSPMSGASRLEVVWEEVLAHPTEEPRPATGILTVPPPQNFFINESRFFITRQNNTGPEVSQMGHWLVSRERPAPAAGGAAGGAAAAAGPSDDPHPAPQADDVENRDYVKKDSKHYDVGEFWLRPRLEEAERKDYQFAVRMQVISF